MGVFKPIFIAEQRKHIYSQRLQHSLPLNRAKRTKTKTIQKSAKKIKIQNIRCAVQYVIGFPLLWNSILSDVISFSCSCLNFNLSIVCLLVICYFHFLPLPSFHLFFVRFPNLLYLSYKLFPFVMKKNLLLGAEYATTTTNPSIDFRWLECLMTIMLQVVQLLQRAKKRERERKI